MTWPSAFPRTRDLAGEAGAWRTDATHLAAFSDARLVNRRDVWGGYYPRGMRETLGKVHTAPRVKDRGTVTLSRSVIARHFAARDEGA